MSFFTLTLIFVLAVALIIWENQSSNKRWRSLSPSQRKAEQDELDNDVGF